MPLPDKFFANVSMEVSVAVTWPLPIVCWVGIEVSGSIFLESTSMHEIAGAHCQHSCLQTDTELNKG